MENITKTPIALIGNTPLVEVTCLGAPQGTRIVGKLESKNPGGSVKDRIALAMIESAEQSGELRSGATIIEPTSGNTGIGLAIVGRVKGYRVILTMPESMSAERRKLLRSLGAQLVLTDAKDGMPGAIAEAEMLQSEIEGAYMPRQFDNPANPKVHYETTGPEIWRDTDGKIDIFIAGVGTGGTLSGAGRFLKEKNPDIKIVAVEPDESAVLSGGDMGPHMIQGIGAGFIPGILDTSIIDETVRVQSKAAIETARQLIKEECLLVGISCGAAANAAAQIAARPENNGKTIVAVFPDGAERYASTLLFYQD